MASYAFTGNPWVIGTSKPHILLAARSGNPGAIGSSTSKPHMLAVGSSTPKPQILLAARAPAIGRKARMPHFLLPVRVGNPGAIDSSTPEPQPFKRFGRFEFQKEDIASEEKLWDLYERWRSHYNVSRSPDEILKRFNTFKRHAIRVHNTNNLNLSYTLGLNEFSDRYHEEVFGTINPAGERQVPRGGVCDD